MLGNRIGPYQLVRKIAEDRFGEVFEALDVWSKKRFAIRALNDEGGARSDTAARLYSEAGTLARLHHPHIARTYGFIRNRGRFFLVLELVEGETLRSVLRTRRRLEPPVVLAYFHQILSAVAFAHSLGVVHGDLKASSIVITNFGRIKVLDFALALLLRDSPDDLDPAAAPESAPVEPVDERCDINFLGALLYECLTGLRPFGSDEVSASIKRLESTPLLPSLLLENCPAWLDAFILRALQPRRSDGFSTVAAMGQAMNAGVSGEAAVPPRRTESWRRGIEAARAALSPARTGRARDRAARLLGPGRERVKRAGASAMQAWSVFEISLRPLERSKRQFSKLRLPMADARALARRATSALRANLTASTIPADCARAADFCARLRTATADKLRASLPAPPASAVLRAALARMAASLVTRARASKRPRLAFFAGGTQQRYAVIAIVAVSAMIELFVFAGTNTRPMSDRHNAALTTQHGAAESFLEPLAHRIERPASPVKTAASEAPPAPKRTRISTPAEQIETPARPSRSRDPEYHEARVARRVVTYRIDPSELRPRERKASKPAPARRSTDAGAQLNVKWEN